MEISCSRFQVGVGWVIQVEAHVRLQAGHPAARSDQLSHFGQYFSGIGAVDQHGPGVDNIERGGRQPGMPGVCLDDLDVRQPESGHQLLRHGGVDRVDLQSYDTAPGPTRSASRSRIPRGPHPTSIALCPSAAPTRSSNSAARGWSSVVCLRNRSASAVSLPSAYVTDVGESDAPSVHRDPCSAPRGGGVETTGVSCTSL
jgi:hypothetical protein